MPNPTPRARRVLLTGATVTTVNPVYTDRELAHQLSDSGAELLITLPDFLGRAQAAMPGSRLREIAEANSILSTGFHRSTAFPFLLSMNLSSW